MQHAHNVLVVESDALSQYQIVSALRKRDYAVTTAGSIQAASDHLAKGRVELLIAATHLYTANGIQFVIAARTRHREMAAILIGPESERLPLEMDGRRYGFAFVVRPFVPEELLMVVAEQLATVRRVQQWPRKRLASEVRVFIARREARLTDVSYGGVGFELPRNPGALPVRLQVELPDSHLQIDGELIWSARRPKDDACVGGIHLLPSAAAVDAWRRFVDKAS